MILQKDLSLYRLDNQSPNEKAPEKYEYQLYKENCLAISKFTDSEHASAKVTITPGQTSMVLISSPSDIDLREMEDQNIFLVDVMIIHYVSPV